MFCDRVLFSLDACPLMVLASFTAVLFHLHSASLLLDVTGTSSVVCSLIIVEICPFFFPDRRLLVFLLNVGVYLFFLHISSFP